jgi:hypothetical protein
MDQYEDYAGSHIGKKYPSPQPPNIHKPPYKGLDPPLSEEPVDGLQNRRVFVVKYFIIST